jgi:hypothetical protein
MVADHPLLLLWLQRRCLLVLIGFAGTQHLVGQQ